MYPGTASSHLIDAIGSKKDYQIMANADYASLAMKRAAQPGMFHRFIQYLRGKWAERQHEEVLIRIWNTSPHLLEDMGVVLTNGAKLPDHLVAAPDRLINHVAMRAPEQVGAAMETYPPQPDQTATDWAEGTAVYFRLGRVQA